jgi:predicted nucleic acid-binding protein
LIAYLDASALVKNYFEEPGSDAVRDLLRHALPATSRLTAVEVASALARRCREGDLVPDDRDQLLRDLNEDLTVLYVVELVSDIVAEARALLLRHPLRAADAVQLASCLVLQGKVDSPMTFAAYDQRLLEAARQEGLDVFEPEEPGQT